MRHLQCVTSTYGANIPNTICDFETSQISARLGMGVGYFWLYLAKVEINNSDLVKFT